MAFELFKKSEYQGCRNFSKPAVFISVHYHQLQFNKVSQYECGFGKGKYVKLWYDRAERIVGIERTTKDDPDGMRINNTDNLSIGKFLQHHKLELKTITGKYLLQAHGALWVFDLKKRMEGRKHK